MSITNKSYIHHRASFFVAILMGSTCLSLEAASMPADSIGVEFENGKKIIIHKLEAKETYFGLGRHYNIPAKNIIAANNNKPLKMGDTLRIPTESSQTVASTTSSQPTAITAPTPPTLSQQDYTQYKVGKGETLQTISKRFIISVESIKRANGLTDDAAKEGSLLKIPHKELPPPIPTASQLIVSGNIIDSTAAQDALDVPANKYGIREMTEKGVGVWIDDLSQDGGSMLALHKTAPIGTVIKITNPMTNHTTYAKVVGKFADTAETQNAIIVISKSAASLIGVLDRRFQVEIAYGTPNEPLDK
ncbi:DPBB and LysM peptidoglycan-binding domain-containing protein [Parapedobacter tibetensis]|uniref:DPBB and LysM peptidoglycan-binding domain-containing protein n=1 Tax=Parapedobacter tibetensis TaxID=2972951 RepID=UPI00214D81DD|nr:LysM peptidoglycan-binding domain-containing protein [Parapedobacter tibetensis]